MTTMINGSAIRKARKAKKMSQAELAADICTQATISSIENQNSYKNLDILCKVCHRLDLKITDVTHNSRYGDRLFSYIEDDMRRHCYLQANERIGRVSFEKLETQLSKGKYYCYQGYASLYIDDDIEEAVYNFNLMLSQYSQSELAFYRVWSNLGLGLAYQKSGKEDRTERFIEESIKILNQIKNDDKVDFFAIVDLYIDIIAVQVELEHYERALDLCKNILNRLTKSNSIYKIDILEELESKCLYAQGQIVQGTMKQFAAMFVAELRGNTALSDKILKQNQAHIVELVKKELAKNLGDSVMVK